MGEGSEVSGVGKQERGAPNGARINLDVHFMERQ